MMVFGGSDGSPYTSFCGDENGTDESKALVRGGPGRCCDETQIITRRSESERSKHGGGAYSEMGAYNAPDPTPYSMFQPQE